jgi:RHS repeat-associated protein
VSPDATGNWSQSLVLQWDAWSRIVQISQNNSVIASYAYDGLSRRLTKTTSGITLHTYYSKAWRPLEERIDPQTTAAAQYFWGARHRDDLVRRDRATTSGGSLDETRYVLTDYFSPAAITDQNGSVTERYAFSAFGVRSILAPNFTPLTTSECAWTFAFQGQFLDEESGFLDYGYRYYSPYLGRWLSRDPIEENGGINLYDYVGNTPVNGIDPLGLLILPPIAGGYHPANGPVNGYDVGIAAGLALAPAVAIEAVGAALAALPALAVALAGMTAGDAGVGAAGAAGAGKATTCIIGVIGRNGDLLAKATTMMSHQEMVNQQLGGEVPEGAQVVSIFMDNAGNLVLPVMNSMTYYGNQLPAPQRRERVLVGLEEVAGLVAQRGQLVKSSETLIRSQ